MARRRFPYWRFVGLGVAAAVMLAVAVQQMMRTNEPRGSNTDQSTVGVTSFPLGEQPKIPSLRGRDLNGTTLQYPTTGDRLAVINIWGSWCAPCRAEAPDLVRISRESRAQGVRFYGIDSRDDAASAQAFVRRFGIQYASFDDRDGEILGAFTGLVPMSAIPSTLIVDSNHHVVSRVVGRVDAGTLRGLIADALTKPSA